MPKDEKMEKQSPIEEAQRYVDNARKTLMENGELDTKLKRYNDRKYVKSAGHFLWTGMLVLLDTLFPVKTKQRPHPDIKDYKEAIAQRDLKLLALVNDGYATMHIAMGYDGNQQKSVCDTGFRLANEIIQICAKMLPKQQNL